MEFKWFAAMMVGGMLAVVLMFAVTGHTNSEQMKACVSSPGHSWVQKHGDHYECLPDSQVTP